MFMSFGIKITAIGSFELIAVILWEITPRKRKNNVTIWSGFQFA